MTPHQSETRLSRVRVITALLIALLIAGTLANAARKSDFDVALLRDAFVADAGINASLPQEVVDARTLLQTYPLEEGSLLSLGQGLRDDTLLQQRMWEALFPQRFSDADARMRILRAADPVAATCTLIERSGDVILADCA
ncbi:MAG: hypothetical protein K0M59_15995 [Stenotrophomonas sp.]|nr:hypothetical protein [Stenotrophomonas sp.]